MNAYRKITRIALIITALWLMLVLYIALSKMTGPLSDIVLMGLFIWLTLMFLAAWLSLSIAAIKDRNTLALILISMSSIASGLLSIEHWDAMTRGADPHWLAITPVAALFGITAFVAKSIDILVSKTATWIKG